MHAVTSGENSQFIQIYREKFVVKQPENYETVDSDLDTRITPAKRVTSSTWGPHLHVTGPERCLEIKFRENPKEYGIQPRRRRPPVTCSALPVCRSFLQSGWASVFARVTIILNSTPSNLPQRLNGTFIKV